MNSPETPADSQAASLAAALIERIGPLAQAAADAKRGIAADRERFRGADEADALIDTVVERVDELEADCRRLMRILVGFEAAAAQPATDATAVEEPIAEEPAVEEPAADAPENDEPAADAPAVEPTPAEEAAGVSTFPGAAPSPSGDAVAAAPPAAGVDSIGAPPSGEPVVAAPPTGEPVIAAPPTGDPVSAAPPDDQPPAQEPEPVVEGAADEPVEGAADEPVEGAPDEPAPAPGQPVHVSEGVRLLATQMSVAGASSEDIARRLHNDFGVEDADRLIAHLFSGRA